MGHRKSQRTAKADKTKKQREREQNEEYDPALNTEAVRKEVQEANTRIADPSERERVIPSRPC